MFTGDVKQQHNYKIFLDSMRPKDADGWANGLFSYHTSVYSFKFCNLSMASKSGAFKSPTEVALFCLKFILSFIIFCSLVT